MHKLARMFLVALFTLLLFSGQAHAIGLGVFVEGAFGPGEAEWESDWDSWDIDSRAASVGFVLDTAPTAESFFNYRLNVGYAWHELEDDFGVAMKSNGVYAESQFGFAFMRDRNFRWWGGPLVRAGYYSGDTDEGIGGGAAEIDAEYVEFGIGGVTGVNFRTGGVVWSPSAGFRVSGYGGEGETDGRFGRYSEDFSAFTTTLFANLAVLF